MRRSPAPLACAALAALLLPACAMIPPFQTAQVLLPGQSTVSADMQLEAQPQISGQEGNASGEPSFAFGYRSSMPWRGTDWGITLIDDGFGLHADIKQALWIPRDPQGFKAALDGEILASVFGGWNDGLSLILTQPLGPLSLTLGTRYGSLTYNIWGEDEGFPGLFDTVTSNYVDLFGGFDFPVGQKGDLVLGLDWRDLVDPSDNNYGGGGEPVQGSWYGLDLGWRSNLFLPFLGDHWATPKIWVPGDSPDQETAEEHLAMARQLRAAGLYQDAVDELNAAQSEDSAPGPMDLELAYDFYMLREFELSYFHYERAARAFPKDQNIKDMLKRLYPVLKYH